MSTNGSPKIKCIIYRTTSIGDVVLATSCFDTLDRLEIPYEVHWVGRQPSLELLMASYPDHHFYELRDDLTAKKVYEELSKLEHVHFILDLQKSLRSNRFCNRLAAAHRIKVHSWDKKSLFRASLIFTAKLRRRKSPLPEEAYKPSFLQHQQMSDALITATREFLSNVNFEPVRKKQAHPKLNLIKYRDNHQKSWCNELKVGRWLAVAPGASYPTKKAPSQLFVVTLRNLAQKLRASEMELGLVYLGDQNDRAEALNIADTLDWPFPTLNLCGQLSLIESSMALTYTKGLLSNDSSLAHICEAVGNPCAVFFGPTVEGFGFAPWRPESLAHSVPLGCRPCSKHGKTPCSFKDLKCYYDIDLVATSDHLFRMVTKR